MHDRKKGACFMHYQADAVSRINEAVDRERDNIVELTRTLIRIPSVTGEEGKIQRFVENYLRSIGLEVHEWEPDITKMKDHPEYIDTGKDYTGRPNVVGIYKGDGGRSLLLNGHTDVVTPEPIQKWSYDPWGAEIHDGKIYGRGACDMKGGVAAMIKALEILGQVDLGPSGDILLEVVVDEESSGNGTLASLLEGFRADAAVFTEPTGCFVMPAHRGGKFWRIHVEGRGAHAGVKYNGISAAEKGMVVYRALEELEKQRNKKGKKMPLYRDYPLTTPICVGKFNSGRYTSAIPEECVLEGTIEFLPGEELEEVKREFEHAIKEACEKDGWLREHQPRIEWFGLSVLPSEIPADHSLVQIFKRAHLDMTGENTTVIGFPAGCDMRIRVLYDDTPSILFGPGDLRYAHRIDEHLEIEELVSYTKTLALAMLGWCGVKEV